MTPPADLDAIRKLVEAFDQSEIECLASIHQTCFHDLVPAAREAVERVERMTDFKAAYEGMVKKFEGEQKQQIALWGRLARLEVELRASATERHNKLHDKGLLPWEPFASCKTSACEAARAALEDQPTQNDTEWQRVHGADAQAARDVAHWRTRAEHAEARLAQLEGRDE